MKKQLMKKYGNINMDELHDLDGDGIGDVCDPRKDI